MPIFWSRIFCSSSGSETFCIVTISSFRPSLANAGAVASCSALANSTWLAARSRKGVPLAPTASEMCCSIRPRSWPSRSDDGVLLARARDLGVEQARVDDPVGVVAEGAQAHRAEVLVADRHRLGRAPALVDLLAGAEEVDVALERALEQLVPVLQVGQHRQRRGGEGVAAGAEDVGDLALVDEHRHLRLAHRERAAVLDLAVFHRETPGQDAIAILGPLDDVDELFLDEIHQRHGSVSPTRTPNIRVRRIIRRAPGNQPPRWVRAHERIVTPQARRHRRRTGRPGARAARGRGPARGRGHAVRRPPGRQGRVRRSAHARALARQRAAARAPRRLAARKRAADRRGARLAAGAVARRGVHLALRRAGADDPRQRRGRAPARCGAELRCDRRAAAGGLAGGGGAPAEAPDQPLRRAASRR